MNERRSGRDLYVVIDPHRVRLGSLELAVVLAERLQVAVAAELVSDEVLKQVARLPFTTEISLSSGRERNLGAVAIDSDESRTSDRIRRTLEQRAQQLRVAIRVEHSAAPMSVSLTLEQRDVFLPALRQAREWRGRRREVPTLHTVKWVWDHCPPAQRCFELLRSLTRAGLTRRIYIYSNKAVPAHLLSELAAGGARVYWISTTAESLLDKLGSGMDVDLLLLPASFCAEIGDARLADLNRRSVAPLLVVG